MIMVQMNKENDLYNNPMDTIADLHNLLVIIFKLVLLLS